MKRFIIKILIFSLPIISLGFEGFLPLSTFTFRPFEALLFIHSKTGMPFYPNHYIQMQSEGDLCQDTKNAIKKEEEWITDEIGYRNNKFINDPDVLLIGDSFLAGVSITQDSTLTNLLIKKFNNEIKFYNLALASLNDFKALFDNEVFMKPQLIILVIGERDLPPRLSLTNKKVFYTDSKMVILFNKAKRAYSLNYMASGILNLKHQGVQSEVDNKWFFYNGREQQNNLKKIDTFIQTVNNYKRYCDSLGIKFLLIPLPNKESVYYEKVPFNIQPQYLFKLEEELKKNNILNINALMVFNQFRQKNDVLIYHYDDTHWNSRGVNIVAEEIVKEIKSNQNLGLFNNGVKTLNSE